MKRSFIPASGLAAQLAVRSLPLDLPRIEIGLMWHRRAERDPAQRWLRATVTPAAQAVARQFEATPASA